MSENGKAKVSNSAKNDVKHLREKLGGMSEKLKEYYKEQNGIRKLISNALKNGPMTIPQLAEECELESSIAVWHLMAMRRYGTVIEGQENNGYLLYALKEA